MLTSSLPFSSAAAQFLHLVHVIYMYIMIAM